MAERYLRLQMGHISRKVAFFRPQVAFVLKSMTFRVVPIQLHIVMVKRENYFDFCPSFLSTIFFVFFPDFSSSPENLSFTTGVGQFG